MLSECRKKAGMMSIGLCWGIPTEKNFLNSKPSSKMNSTLLTTCREQDAICAKFTFETARRCLSSGRQRATSQKTWLQDKPGGLSGLSQTTDSAKRLSRYKARHCRTSCRCLRYRDTSEKALRNQDRLQYWQCAARIRLLFADDYLTVHPGVLLAGH